MGAIDAVINGMKGEISQLPTDELGGVIFEGAMIGDMPFEHMLRRLPPLEALLSPEPDVETEREIREDSDVLGIYTRMRSPGIVALRSRAIRNFFWRIIGALRQQPFGAFITVPDLERIATMIAKKTYYHEIFHFNSDVFGMLFGSIYDPYPEEAFAVAYARLMIQRDRSSANTQIGRINAVLYNKAIELSFQYRSEGYRDWVLYSDEVRFKNGLVDYIKPGQYQRLQGNAVAVEDLLFDMLGKPQGFVERVR